MTLADLGKECLDFAEQIGSPLDPEQRDLIVESLQRRKGGQWEHSTVGDGQPRQNGKGETAQDRFGFGACVLGEKVLWTAHEMATARDAHQRAIALLSTCPDTDRLISKLRYANGEEAIEFKGGGGIFYRTRTDKAGRGLPKIGAVVVDEAQHTPRSRLAASMPARAIAKHAQAWFSGTAAAAKRVGDRKVSPTDAEVWWDMRLAHILGKGGSMLFREQTAETWEVQEDGTVEFTAPEPADHANWFKANAALRHGPDGDDSRPDGLGMTLEFLADELVLLGEDLFSQEHLMVWEPIGVAEAKGGQSKLAMDAWRHAREAGSEITGGLVFTVDVGWDEASTCVVAAGRAPGGWVHVETVQKAAGTAWVESWMADRVAKHRPGVIAYDSTGPARVLKTQLEAVVADRPGTKLRALTGPDYAAACAGFVEAVNDRRVRHLGDVDITNAIDVAAVRAYGKDGAWFWNRAGGRDVAALVGASIGSWVALSQPQRRSAYDRADAGVMLV